MIWDWFLGLFNKDGVLSLDVAAGSLESEVVYKELAIRSAVNLISNAVARGEFLTYEKGLEVYKHNYYLLNVEANQNKSAHLFWKEVVSKMLLDGECLVVQINDMFYIADSFTRVKYALAPNFYKDVSIGDYKLKDTFSERDVLYFELANEKIKTVLEGLCLSYSKLITASQKNFKKNKTRKGILDIPTNYAQTPKAQSDLNDLMNNKFSKYFSSESDAVLPLQNGMKYTESKKEISSNEGREIRAFIDDIFDFTAIGFQIPPTLLKGSVADNSSAANDFLTFRVKPIAEIISDELNRKMYGKESYMIRTYCKLDTSRIKVVDLKDIASSLDILTRIGANSVNDSLRSLGRETINEPWANERFMTKNYELLRRFSEDKKGETNEKQGSKSTG